jgi:hypothetical protein
MTLLLCDAEREPAVVRRIASSRSPGASEQARAADASVGTRASCGADFRVLEWTRHSSDSGPADATGCIGKRASVGDRDADDPGLRNRVEARAGESRAKVENSVAHAAPAFPETKCPDLSAPHSWLARAFARPKRVRPGLGATAFLLAPATAALSQRWHEQ